MTYHPTMTSVGDTLLWSSYMFLANSMSTATCWGEKKNHNSFHIESNTLLSPKLDVHATSVTTGVFRCCLVCDFF